MNIFKKKELTPEEQRAEKIKSMARFYLSRKKYTFQDVALKFECSSSTVGKYFNKMLQPIDEKLYEKVQAKIKEVKIAQNERFKKELANRAK